MNYLFDIVIFAVVFLGNLFYQQETSKETDISPCPYILRNKVVRAHLLLSVLGAPVLKRAEYTTVSVAIALSVVCRSRHTYKY